MRLQTLLLTATLVASSSSALAAPITALYVFGDSLSDNGNLTAIVAQATGGAVTVPAAPYAPGRASNGPVAVEYLASLLGLPLLTPAAVGGTNYAVIGAATRAVPLPTPVDPLNTADNVAELLGLALPVPTGMTNAQVPQFLQSLTGPISPRALFVLWGGPNDLAISPSIATAQAAADAIAAALDALYAAGARRFLVPGMPDLGLTPGASNPAVFSALSAAFNLRLNDNLKQRAGLPGLILTPFETDVFFQQAVAGDLGFANVTDACVAGNVLFAARVCGVDDEAGYLFWDDTHPTTAAHKMLGGAFAEAVTATQVPEPGSVMLVAGALGALALRRRRAA